jgi:hypothetical protein
MLLRRLALALVLAAVAGTAAGCIVVPAPPPRAVVVRAVPAPVYAPPPCRWFWIYNHWECR